MSEYIKENIWRFFTYGIYLIIFVILFAIIINYATIWNMDFDISDNSTWIGFYATIFAAIIGGIISGGLTLLGVIHTIKYQDKKDKRNELPKKMMKAERIYEKISHLIESLEKYNQLDETKSYLPKHFLPPIKECVVILKEEKLNNLEDAAYVSFEFYDEVFLIYKKIDNINEIVNADYLPEGYYEYSDRDDRYVGYNSSIYERIKDEIEEIEIDKIYLKKLILKLRNEYNELTK